MKKETILHYFKGNVHNAVSQIPEFLFNDIQEIRLRVNKPLSVMCGFKPSYITPNGNLTCNSANTVTVTEQELNQCFEAVCQYSVHSFKREICEGFVTLKGGHRVGLCGTTVIHDGTIENIKNVSSLNFRISHQLKGCAEKIYNQAFSHGLSNVLIAGAPMSGKTTLLRDLTRILGNNYKTSVIDERGEIAAVCNGIPQNDVGINTDVFDGYPKPEGISTAVRVMSPQVIICDEIGGDKDMTAIKQASYCGVYVVATIHAINITELIKRAGTDVFGKIVFLSEKGSVATIMTRTVNGYA